jgi:N-acetyl-D-muramate 6-phosphate phosphatase|tara:strand:- start:8533 stop:9195 length:663 start_codon:yes stop_codon:yes gene_type:complete
VEFKALLFDLDGTLLDTAPDFISALNAHLKLHKRPPIPAAAIRNAVTNGSIGLVQVGFGVNPGDPTFDSIREEYLDLYLNNIANKTCLFEGLQAVLDTCLIQQIPWGIVTNKPWKYTQPVLEKLGLIKNAATIICPDHVKHPKPDPEAMFAACAEMSISPSDCLYVGDHLRDIEAGRAAGMRTIAAGWGYIDAGERVEDWRADHIVEHSSHLYNLLFNPQ